MNTFYNVNKYRIVLYAMLMCLFVITIDSIAQYCPSKGKSVRDEWISEIKLVGSNGYTFSNPSPTQPDSGYTDFTTKTIDIITGNIYSITLTPGYSKNIYREYFKIWVDLNHDNDFQDNGEMVFDAENAFENAITRPIKIPYTAIPGLTRMRISMRFNAAPVSPCDTFNYGEVEDYTVNLIADTFYLPISCGKDMNMTVDGKSRFKKDIIINGTMFTTNTDTNSIKGIRKLAFETDKLRFGVSKNNKNNAAIGTNGTYSGMTFITHGSDGWNERLTIDHNGMVGIGLNPSSYPLEVNGTIKASGSKPKLQLISSEVPPEIQLGFAADGKTYWAIQPIKDTVNYKNRLDFGQYNNGHKSTQLSIVTGATGGGIGIGITNPAADLHVDGTIMASNPEGASFQLYDSYDYWSISTGFPKRGLIFNKLSEDTIDTKMIIDPKGYLGIGTTEPKAKLDVNGTIMASGNEPKLQLLGNELAPEILMGSDEQTWIVQAQDSAKNYRLNFDYINKIDDYDYTVMSIGNRGVGIFTEPDSFVSLTVDGLVKVKGEMAGLEFGNNNWVLCPEGNNRLSFSIVNGDQQWERKITFDKLGRVGIGTTEPNAQLEVTGHIRVSGEEAAILELNSEPNKDDGWSISGSNYLSFTKVKDNVGYTNMIIAENGNVCIGENQKPKAKLEVEGEIVAKSFSVGEWVIKEAPDYVFSNKYDLPKLKDVEKYVNENKHLPGVPSADSIKRNGLDLVEMNMTLLKKLEELTLYAIEQSKSLKTQQQMLMNQQKEIEELKKSLEIRVKRN